MKKAFYTFISLLIWLNSNSQILHLIVVADITDKTFGTVSSNDITTIESLFSTSAKYIDHKFQPIFLTNASFNSNSVKNAINKLKSQPNDMIVFYYSGYGFYHAKSKSEFPTFKFDVAKKDILSLDEVGKLINQKGVRLGLAIADCREEKAEYRQAYPPFIGESFLKLAYQKVFLESCGLIKVAASSKGYKNTILDYKSAFMGGFSKALGNLHLVELNDIDELNLIKILNDTQKDIDLALGKPIQKMIWKKDVCGDSQKSLSRKFPSYKNAPTMLG
jgi:Caspase domain